MAQTDHEVTRNWHEKQWGMMYLERVIGRIETGEKKEAKDEIETFLDKEEFCMEKNLTVEAEIKRYRS